MLSGAVSGGVENGHEFEQMPGGRQDRAARRAAVRGV